MSLTYSPTFSYQSNGVQHGISAETKQSHAAQVQAAISKVEDNLKKKSYGFVNILDQAMELFAVKNVCSQLRWAKNLVVVGIGGSDLGARAIQDAIEPLEPALNVIFHGDSTDPVAITRLLGLIDLDDTVFCIISKSGETIETISQYVFFKNVLKKEVEDWTEHFVFITDAHKGVLKHEATEHHILTLNVPDDVGGRFSVQTTVGLLPAAAMGVEVDEIVRGGQDAVQHLRSVAQEIATTQFLLAMQGMKINVLMPYSVQLEEFGRWYRQLWAESLGKDGKGILPIKAWGPADQHSQVQFYTEGELLHSLLFIRIEERGEEDYLIEDVDVKAVEYLEGKSFHEILNAEQEATALALKKLGRPSATLSVSELSAFSLGQLFLVFELAVVYLAEMFEIDAFNQPGVEEGKQLMYALLGRAGWEDKKKEVEALRVKK